MIGEHLTFAHSSIFDSSINLQPNPFSTVGSSDIISPKVPSGNLGATGKGLLGSTTLAPISSTVTIAAIDVKAAETLVGAAPNLGKFKLTRTGNLAESLTVSYSTLGTATNGQDYDSLTGSATFAAGASTALIQIKPIDDSEYEGTETIQLVLNPGERYSLGTATSAAINLTDNDKPLISISASDANAAETLVGQTRDLGAFTLTRQGSLAEALTVSYLIGGTATNGRDYSKLTSSVTFAAGSSTAVVQINPLDDKTYEENETIELTLKDSASYSLGSSKSATVRLLDNDKQIISISASDASAAETLTGQLPNVGEFILTRKGDITQALTASYTVSGSATNGRDYDSLTGAVTFAAGAAAAAIKINPIADQLREGTESVTLTLNASSGYNLDQSSASVSIEDYVPFITITSVSGGEVLTTDSSYNITWNDNINDNVKIDLYKGDSLLSVINESTPSDGSESWTVPTALVSGSDYSFKITSLADSSLFGFSSRFSVADWFTQNLHDADVSRLTQALAADGTLSRSDIMGILRSTTDYSVIDAVELADLKAIFNSATRFNLTGPALNLYSKVINGDLANQNYQGSTLGNLFAGSSSTQMENLIGKWFLGSDRPFTTYTYKAYSQPLFANGISADDVAQGLVGDCYFLSTLASIANEQPKYIQEMFTDNGDGTFTVRFLNKGVADYVTVDRFLPTATWGAAYANSAKELWVALAEKAYAQLAESGWSRKSIANAYSSISGGWMSWVIPQITGLGVAQYKSVSLTTKQQIIDLSNSNNILAVGFVNGTVAGDGIVNGHAYSITGYNAATDTFFLRNPWGYQHVSVTWEQLMANKALFEWSV